MVWFPGYRPLEGMDMDRHMVAMMEVVAMACATAWWMGVMIAAHEAHTLFCQWCEDTEPGATAWGTHDEVNSVYDGMEGHVAHIEFLREGGWKTVEFWSHER